MKKAEAWLKALAHTAREEDIAADPKWDAFAAGKLSSEEEAALREVAQRSSAGRAAYEAFRPFKEAERAEIEARILAATAGEGAADPPPRSGAVIPLRRRRALLGFAAAATLAAAAAALVISGTGEPPLPAYELAMAGGEQEARGTPAPSDTPHFGPGSRVEIVLRPKIAAGGEVGVRGALVQGGRSRAWQPPIERTPEGVVRVAGVREAVFPEVPDGPWEIVLAVGRPAALPEDPAAGSAGEGVQILRARVVLGARPAAAP